MKLVYHGILEGDHVRWDEGQQPDRALGAVPVTVVVDSEVATRSTPLIQSRPEVSGGDACFGTYRIPVWLVVDAWQQGWTDDEVLRAHPVLRPVHLEAARAYYSAHREEIDTAIVENSAA
jgi:uncharacterized protein (DUF433 family)